jgi:hypothetical protein
MTATLSLADFDLSTRSASAFLLKHIIPRLEPVLLYGPLARRLPFSLVAPHSDVIVMVGHGDSDQTTGQNDAALLKIGEYGDDEIQNKVIYALSCLSAEQLGPDLINHGAAAFLGWMDDYLWIVDESESMTPWNDKMATPCLMPVIAGLNALLDGKTVSEVKNIQDASYSYYADNTDNELVKALVEFNKSNFVVYGDPNAKINPRPPLASIFKVFSPPPMLLPV